MKIQNKFAELIKQKRKTIEIRKEKSAREIINATCNCDLSYNKSLMHIDMQIIDCDCLHISPDGEEGYDNNCNNECDFSDNEEGNDTPLLLRHNLDGILEGFETGEGFDEVNKISAVEHANYKFFSKYLKDEEYCIIYNINLEETFKTNGWEMKLGDEIMSKKIECEFCDCENRQECYRCVDPHLNDNGDFKCKCDRRQQCLCGDGF